MAQAQDLVVRGQPLGHLVAAAPHAVAHQDVVRATEGEVRAGVLKRLSQPRRHHHPYDHRGCI